MMRISTVTAADGSSMAGIGYATAYVGMQGVKNCRKVLNVLPTNGVFDSACVWDKHGNPDYLSELGAATYVGADTYIGKDCIISPEAFRMDYENIRKQGYRPNVYIHPDAMVITPYDYKIAMAFDLPDPDSAVRMAYGEYVPGYECERWGFYSNPCLGQLIDEEVRVGRRMLYYHLLLKGESEHMDVSEYRLSVPEAELDTFDRGIRYMQRYAKKARLEDIVSRYDDVVIENRKNLYQADSGESGAKAAIPLLTRLQDTTKCEFTPCYVVDGEKDLPLETVERISKNCDNAPYQLFVLNPQTQACIVPKCMNVTDAFSVSDKAAGTKKMRLEHS